MPTFLYVCENNPDPNYPENNGTEFEDLSLSSNKPLEVCPVCKEKGMPDHAPKRLINMTFRGQVELTGKDLDAKIKSDVRHLKNKARTNENFYTNLIGEDKINKSFK
jgi:hypothetical protein